MPTFLQDQSRFLYVAQDSFYRSALCPLLMDTHAHTCAYHRL